MRVPIVMITLLAAACLEAQDLLLPRNIESAYAKQTRSLEGKPGNNYWQNHSDYKINAIVDTDRETLSGEAVINYHNNSPDTLKNMVIRLYQDIFRKGNARQWPINIGDLTEGVKIKKLVIDGKTYDPEKDFPGWYITNFTVRLKNAIAPHSETRIEIDWEMQIPTERGLRMRKYFDGHYFIAYWYPQIAVYDDIDGWDRVEYLGMVEFYNDFNNYDINLTVPGDYLVRSTGEVQNWDEILQKKILTRLEEAKNSDEVIRIITPEDYQKNQVFKEAITRTWKIKAIHVPDFSFAMSTRSNWDGASVVVDSATMRRVFTDALYPDGTRHWDRGAEITRASVSYMSFELPGVPFPYPHMTSFCAGSQGGGMETPMMANDGAPKGYNSFVELIFHEIAHSYFPFYMGTNERKYAWMDEGWAAFLPAGFSDKMDLNSNYLADEIKGYLRFAGEEADLPLMVPSYQHNNYSSARIAAYNHPATAYHVLMLTLGEDRFKEALQTYINRWKGKHPIPYDFFNSFNDAAGENLYWFWEPWFFEPGYPDLGITRVEGNEITIIKKGNYPVPVMITCKTTEGGSLTLEKPTSVWKDGKELLIIEIPPEVGKIERVQLGNDTIPDVDKSDNIWPPMAQ